MTLDKSGQDMLIMKREDFIQIGQDGPHKASMAECIRLFNAVEKAKMSEQTNNLVLYCQVPGEQVADCYYPIFLRERTVQGEFSRSLIPNGQKYSPAMVIKVLDLKF